MAIFDGTPYSFHRACCTRGSYDAKRNRTWSLSEPRRQLGPLAAFEVVLPRARTACEHRGRGTIGRSPKETQRTTSGFDPLQNRSVTLVFGDSHFSFSNEITIYQKFYVLNGRNKNTRWEFWAKMDKMVRIHCHRYTCNHVDASVNSY